MKNDVHIYVEEELAEKIEEYARTEKQSISSSYQDLIRKGFIYHNIDFKDKTLSIVKNVTNMCGDHGYWQITTPQTRTSTRTLPMLMTLKS